MHSHSSTVSILHHHCFSARSIETIDDCHTIHRGNKRQNRLVVSIQANFHQFKRYCQYQYQMALKKSSKFVWHMFFRNSWAHLNNRIFQKSNTFPYHLRQCHFIDWIHLFLMIKSRFVFCQYFKFDWFTLEKLFYKNALPSNVHIFHGNVNQCIHEILYTRIEWNVHMKE